MQCPNLFVDRPGLVITYILLISYYPIFLHNGIIQVQFFSISFKNVESSLQGVIYDHLIWDVDEIRI